MPFFIIEAKEGIHSLRHTNATLLIANGVSLTTVAGNLGYSNSSTTTQVYAHAIQSAAAPAEVPGIFVPVGNGQLGKIAFLPCPEENGVAPVLAIADHFLRILLQKSGIG